MEHHAGSLREELVQFGRGTATHEQRTSPRCNPIMCARRWRTCSPSSVAQTSPCFRSSGPGRRTQRRARGLTHASRGCTPRASAWGLLPHLITQPVVNPAFAQKALCRKRWTRTRSRRTAPSPCSPSGASSSSGRASVKNASGSTRASPKYSTSMPDRSVARVRSSPNAIRRCHHRLSPSKPRGPFTALQTPGATGPPARPHRSRRSQDALPGRFARSRQRRDAGKHRL